ncbi:MAG: formylglycine-generating enzyme family protein [Planctomycetota bacterium]|jgi:formylglycine-generating enzyme required for sulfatase activity
MKRFSNFRIFVAIIVLSAGLLFSAETTIASADMNAPISAGTIASLTSVSALPGKYIETVTDADDGKFTFNMVLIPGGKFTMGSLNKEAGRKDNEGPQHEVKLDPFYLCTTETTFELFWVYYEETVQRDRGQVAKEKDLDAITGPTPIYGDPTMGMGGGKRPAIGATWLNAMTFCRWLSKKTGKNYRLPTEAEWEYAARAGTDTAYFFGNEPKQLAAYAWFEDNPPTRSLRKSPIPGASTTCMVMCLNGYTTSTTRPLILQRQRTPRP